MSLNETLQIIWDAHKIFETWDDKKAYLKKHGYKIPKSTYYKKLDKIKTDRRDRLYDIAKDATNNTADRIATFYTCENLLFEIYRTATNDAIKIRVIKEIKELQYDISAYEESTQGSLERDVKLFGDQKNREPESESQTQSNSSRKTRSATPKAS